MWPEAFAPVTPGIAEWERSPHSPRAAVGLHQLNN